MPLKEKFNVIHGPLRNESHGTQCRATWRSISIGYEVEQEEEENMDHSHYWGF